MTGRDDGKRATVMSPLYCQSMAPLTSLHHIRQVVIVAFSELMVRKSTLVTTCRGRLLQPSHALTTHSDAHTREGSCLLCHYRPPKGPWSAAAAEPFAELGFGIFLLHRTATVDSAEALRTASRMRVYLPASCCCDAMLESKMDGTRHLACANDHV